MFKIKIYQCFHDVGSTPKEKYLSDIRPVLLCGAVNKERTGEITIEHLTDASGYASLSYANSDFSELTGLYWAWMNDDVDIAGIEHYRRHFIKKDAKIDNNVKTEDLLDKNQIIDILSEKDFIVPVREELWNTSVYDLHKICFGDESTDEWIKWALRYFEYYGTSKGITKGNRYHDALCKYMSGNYLYRGNMFITTRSFLDDYCKDLFDFLFYLKRKIKYKPGNRTFGYISENFPMIYILAHRSSFEEVDVAVDDQDWETKVETVHTTQGNGPAEFNIDRQAQINYFESLI